MNFEQARFNMVEQQIRTWDVLDPVILNLISTLRREDFVPSAQQALAFADLELPLGHGQHMWTPKMEARVVQDVRLTGREHVLEVGTGSGYLTALLAARCAKVTSIEIVPELSAQAGERLAFAGITNVALRVGDGTKKLVSDAPFDVVVFTGSLPVMLDAALEWVGANGKVFAIVGNPPAMTARIFTRTAEGSVLSERLFETSVPPLANAPQAAGFSF